MKVLVVYPPLEFPANLYASLSVLLGQLQNRGIDATAIDMNVEFLKEILSVEYIKKTKEKLEKIYEETENKDFRDVIENYLKKDSVIDEIIKSKKNLYSDLIDKNISEENKIILSKVLSFCFLPTYPSLIELVLSSKFRFLREKNKTFRYNYADIIERCFDKTKNIYIEYFKKKLKEINVEQYDLVAITVPFDTHLYPALTLAKIIKEQTSAKVAIGGVLINSTIENYIKHDDMFDTFADVFLIGEGERALPEYVEFLEGKRTLDKVSGAVYKKNGIVKNNGFARISSAKEIMPLSLKGIDIGAYSDFEVYVEFSKGCYWGKCTYCYSKRQKRYYLFDVKKAVDMIENIVNEYGVRSFYILDDSLNPKFAEKFADEIINRKLDISYYAFFRFEKCLNKKFLKKLQQSGLKGIFFGLESASPRILKLMNKGIDIKQVEKIFKDCYSLQIKLSVGIMFGYPSETEEDVIRTIEFLKKYAYCINNINIFYFTLLKSSGLMSDLHKVGISKTYDYEEFSEYLIHQGPCITKKRLKELLAERDLATLCIFSRW